MTFQNKNTTQQRIASFYESAITTESPFISTEDLIAWFREREAANVFRVEEIPFNKLDKWSFDNVTGNLGHESGKFFTVEGINVEQDFYDTPSWQQPIINQPEIGILGIITKVIDGVRYFLMQAKMEPGNVNIIQLSPTVQATKSNYTRVHQGKLPQYLDYFLDRSKGTVIVDALQTEQGGRFLRKRNRNIIIEVTDDIEIKKDFTWLTLGQIKQLTSVNNIVNMDARSVLACIPFSDLEEPGLLLQTASAIPHGHKKDIFNSLTVKDDALHSINEIISWFTDLKTNYELHTTRIPLKNVEGWIKTENSIEHTSGKYFSVIAVNVEAGSREVISWIQPLLKDTRQGILGFITKKINGLPHYLVQAKLEPGNIDVIEMAPTVSTSMAEKRYAENKNAIPFLKYFIEAPEKNVRYDTVQSEEGGRFYHIQNRNMLVEIPQEEKIEIPHNFMWMTLGQIKQLVKHSYFNIESRSLINYEFV